ncbi:acylneuraminate cytidylyltransferase family protein [Pelagibacteraceae bacterium]|nr:acylneuraminate cytidylyltransferase family protein [Pelagibacteraceae bacterium]
MSVLCTICARGESKGLTNKALRSLNGKPLISYTIKQAINSKAFDHIVASTDSKNIAEKVKFFGLKTCLIRPKELATDTSSKILVIRHALLESEKLYKKEFDIIVDLDITSPLRRVDDIKKSLKQFIDTGAENLISACPSKKNPYFNMVEIVNDQVQIVKKDIKQYTRRQEAPLTYEMNASIYIWKRDALFASDELFTDKTSLYKMSEKQAIDIDNENDLNIVEFLLKKENYND